MKIKYKNPPINELIIGAYFDQPIVSLRSEHVGLFWAQVRKEFPKIQQQPELSPPIVPPSITFQFGIGEPYPMPRFWLLAEDEITLMQIQKNAFIFNWRKRNADYPHFDNVKSLFDRYFETYSGFLRKELGVENLTFQIAELTYNNLIEPGEYWSDAGDTKRVIPSFSIPDLGMPIETSPDFNYLTAYRISQDLILNVSVRTARSTIDAAKPLLIIEFRALGALEAVSKADADAWYGRAHEIIGRCFAGVTNPDIQRDHWQPL